MILYGVIFVVGLIMGSFINGHICRRETIDPVPVIRYMIMTGKRRHYGEKTSARYLLVELVSGLVSVLLFAKYGLTVDFGALLFLMYLLIPVFFIDLEYQIIPNELVIVGMVGGTIIFFYNLFRPVLIYSDRLWWNPLVGLVSGSGFLLSVAFLGSLLYKNEEVMGMGDIKLFAPIGLFLGWRMTLVALFISIILGGIAGILLMLLGKTNRKSMIPFGPFIVLGVFITAMWGWELLYWYLRTCF